MGLDVLLRPDSAAGAEGSTDEGHSILVRAAESAPDAGVRICCGGAAPKPCTEECVHDVAKKVLELRGFPEEAWEGVCFRADRAPEENHEACRNAGGPHAPYAACLRRGRDARGAPLLRADGVSAYRSGCIGLYCCAHPHFSEPPGGVFGLAQGSRAPETLRALVGLGRRLGARTCGSALVANAGVSGETTLQMLERLPALLKNGSVRNDGTRRGHDPPRPWHVVFLLAGTNDVAPWSRLSAEDRTAARVAARVERLHRACWAAGVVATAAVTLPPLIPSRAVFSEANGFSRANGFDPEWDQEALGRTVAAVNEQLRSFVRASGGRAFLVDLAETLREGGGSRGGEEWVAPDGVHLTPRGADALGKLAAQRLVEVLGGHRG
jgi:lysophospholipase L1-like esterase